MLSRNRLDSARIVKRLSLAAEVAARRGAPAGPSVGSPFIGSQSFASPSIGSPSFASPSIGSPSLESPSIGSPSVGAPSVASPSRTGRIVPWVALLLLLTSVATGRAETGHRGVAEVDAWFTVTTSDVPTPSNCVVEPADALNGLVLAPDLPTPVPASVIDIYVRNAANNPMPQSGVEVRLEDGIALCSSNVLTGTTDANGFLRLTLAGGGCLHGLPFSGVIKANGITIRAYSNVKSPDYDGGGGDQVVDLADLISFSGEFLGGDGECHDYDNDGKTDLGDLIIFSPAFMNGNNCP